MLYRKMNKTGDKLSILGFGCMRFPAKNGRIIEEKAEHLILRAIQLGVNYFDTAFPYHSGASESFLGRVISKHGLRDQVKLATKLPIYLVHKQEEMDRFLNKQLSNLQTKQIDYYLFEIRVQTLCQLIGFYFRLFKRVFYSHRFICFKQNKC